MTTIKIRNLNADLSWGSVVEGVDAAALERPDIRRQLADLFVERGLIVFEGVEESTAMHVAISNVFGPLKEHPAKTAAQIDDAAARGVLDMHWRGQTDGSDIGHVLLDGEKIARYSPWHFDHCYVAELNRGGVLRAIVTPQKGGRTGFIDGIALYDELPRDLVEKIDGLNVIYTLDVRLSKMRFGRPPRLEVLPEAPDAIANVREGLRFPRAMHPAIWTRETGEKVLHVGAWMAAGLEGHEDAEGDALLDAVCQAIRAQGRGYWHSWKPGDMVIWDNWRMLHAVEGIDPAEERRTQRTTIKGDYGFGYFEDGKQIGDVEREFVA